MSYVFLPISHYSFKVHLSPKKLEKNQTKYTGQNI